MEDDFGHAEDMDETEALEAARAALVDSVRHHLVADVPVGAFLSGGVDSAALVGLLSELHDGPVKTVTLSFDVAELDAALAAVEARRLDLLQVDRESFALPTLGRKLAAMREELLHGRGFALVRGLPVERLTFTQAARFNR